MTDDELAAAAADVFRHFDRREAEDERARLVKEWMLAVFCWDGILPVFVIFVPRLMSFVFARNDAVEVCSNLIIPIGAFFVRVVMGNHYFESRAQYVWQKFLFCGAIFYLVLVEALMILLEMNAAQVKAADWIFLGIMYSIYLAAMALALFPFRLPASQHSWPQLD